MPRFVVEHKTTSSDIAPGSTYWRKLTLDTQVSQYLRGVDSVDGMLYDVIRKPSIRPYKATPEESRKYTKAGALYAGQREADETPEEWAERLIADISAKPDAYYRRGTIVRTSEEASEAMRDTWLVAGSIRESMANDAWPRNPGSCDSYGRTCEYWPVCAGETTIDDDRKYRTSEAGEGLPGVKHRLPLLSNNGMSAYRSCPRKYQYSHVLRRRPLASSEALTFGTLMHAALEVWWSTVNLTKALDVLNADENPYTRATANALMCGYHVRWADAKITVIAVEKVFVSPLVNPSTGAASRTFELSGKCDAIAEV